MHITRRYFLKTCGALAAYCGVSPVLSPGAEAIQLGASQAVTKGRTLVIVFLRGGMDGLNFIVPYGEDAYYKLRRELAIAPPGKENGAIDLDGFFGLHPRAALLQAHFQSGHAVALQAAGYGHNTRSYFEEQDVWETGIIGNTVYSDGWLNRHLMTSQGHGSIRAISIGDTLPRILRGKAPAYALRGISDLTLPGTDGDAHEVAAALEHAYCSGPRREQESSARDLLSQTARTTLDGIEELRKISGTPYQPQAEYPKNSLANKLKEIARLIKADVGIEVAEVDYDGWDTHQNQGGVDGSFGNLCRGLAESLDAFSRDLGDRMNDVLVLTLSDFGRTAQENGTRGTDHGWANCMLAMGGTVASLKSSRKGPVIGNWPGLKKEQLHQQRDLLHTTDFRDVIAEVVASHLGNTKLASILPGHEFKKVGLVAS
jgi:uncharacterized protein (DUF1501 family)